MSARQPAEDPLPSPQDRAAAPAPPAERDERFRPTSGRFTGVIGLMVAAAVALSGLAGEEYAFPLPARLFAVLAGVLIWSASIRPQISLVGPDLVLRNMLDTTRIPLAAIEEILTRRTFIAWVGRDKYVSPALNRSVLQLRAAGRQMGPGAPKMGYVDYVEEKIRLAMAAERVRLGTPARSKKQQALGAEVRRTRAWPEIVALVGSGLAFLVSLVL